MQYCLLNNMLRELDVIDEKIRNLQHDKKEAEHVIKATIVDSGRLELLTINKQAIRRMSNKEQSSFYDER